MADLKDFIVSRVRVKLLETFLSQPNEKYYVRQLTRITDEEINAVRRELQNLEKIGFLKSESRGNRLYYAANKYYDFYSDLLRMVAKTTGLGGAIRKHKARIGKIKFALISGKFVRALERDPSEVDLLLVGDIILPELTKVVSKIEAELEQEINYTAMTLDEFNFRKARRDPFLLNILNQTRVMIIGDEQELLATSKESEDQL